MTPHPASSPRPGVSGQQSGTPGTGGRRSAEDLLAEWRARGEVVGEAARPAFLFASSILLPLSIGTLLFGLVAAGVAVVQSEPSAAVAAVGVFALAIALAAGAWWARRASRSRPGRVWVVSRQGITIDGVGPIPWGDLEPPTQRMETAPRDEGNQLALVMPFTPAGQQQADLLDPALRGVLNENAAPRVFGTPRVTSVRIVAMKGTSQREFFRFLTWAHTERTGS